MYIEEVIPVRDCAPCKGCTREGKAPGCHDRCEAYKQWKHGVDYTNEKRREYIRKPFSRIT